MKCNFTLQVHSSLSLNHEFVNIVQQNTSVFLYFLVSNHDCSLNEKPRASSLACPSLSIQTDAFIEAICKHSESLVILFADL